MLFQQMRTRKMVPCHLFSQIGSPDYWYSSCLGQKQETPLSPYKAKGLCDHIHRLQAIENVSSLNNSDDIILNWNMGSLIRMTIDRIVQKIFSGVAASTKHVYNIVHRLKELSE